MEATYDVTQMTELSAKLRRMAGVDVSKTMKKVWADVVKPIEKHLQEVVKQRYPHKKGILRGKKYGPLYKDIDKKIWSKGGGACVYIFRNNKGRQCVLRWLDAGTQQRQTERHKKPAYRGFVPADNFFHPAVDAVAQSEINRGAEAAAKEITKLMFSV